LLIVAQVISCLCALVAIYAIYDAYDFYSDVSEAGIDHIGWGLIVTLVAATVLFVLCLVQYLRTGSERTELG
jgi:TRAP-type C4-dicarboxylate transport system permease small subunit